MTHKHPTIGWRLAWIVAAMFAIAGCDTRKSEAPTRDQIDAAVQKTGDATVAAARKAADLAETARDKTVAFAKSPQVRQDAANAKQALDHAIDEAREPAPPPATPSQP